MALCVLAFQTSHVTWRAARVALASLYKQADSACKVGAPNKQGPARSHEGWAHMNFNRVHTESSETAIREVQTAQRRSPRELGRSTRHETHRMSGAAAERRSEFRPEAAGACA
eukprot:CAMPEP_0170403486 /NCGR_PEP_ID=MMETSP0117_2-20130122/26120_1 /TAXON_ID=400756 /ORGANISM="Durinskia baltica, Strain CSIRO CS-38" /LENGTH=112 /DNA_ID=CAMNT_0010660431 /DNA_START=120 /DNA_END=456 /DNA_ORIENTATION=+